MNPVREAHRRKNLCHFAQDAQEYVKELGHE
jgi:hypothetical protein